MSNVGYATLQVLPSLKNLRRNLQKEADPVLSAWARTAGKSVGDSLSAEAAKTGLGDRIAASIARGAETGGDQAAGVLRDQVSKSTHEGARSGVRTGVLAGADGVHGKLRASLSSAVSDGVGPSLSGSVLGSLRGLAASGAPAIAGAAIAAGVAPAVGAAVTSGVLLGLGGGVLAAGIAGAARSSKVRKAWAGFGKTAEGALAKFSKPFEAPLIRAAGTFSKALKGMSPELAQIGKATAPLVDLLAPALAGMAKNMLPGILAGLKGAIPLFETIAAKLPAFGTGLGTFFARMAEAGPGALTFIRGFMTALTKGPPLIAGYLADLTNRFGVMVTVGRQIAALVAPAFSKVATAVRSFIAGAKSGDGVFARLKGFLSTLKAPLAQLGAALGDIGRRFMAVWRSQLQPFFAELGAKLGPLFSEWGQTIRSVITNLTPIVQGIATVFGFLWTKLGLGKIVLDTIKTAFSGVVNVLTGAIRMVRGIFTVLAGIFTGDWSKIWSGLTTIASGFLKSLLGTVQILLVGRIGGLVKGLVGKLGGWFAGMFGKIGSAAAGWAVRMVGHFVSLRGRAISAVSGLVSRVASFFTSMMGRAVSAVASGVSRVVTALRGLASKAIGALTGLASRFYGIASDVIAGFVRGIRAGAGRIIDAVRSTITNALPGYVRSALGIHSPSRVFAKLGLHVAEGMALGINQGAGRVTKAAANLTRVAERAAPNGNIGVTIASALQPVMAGTGDTVEYHLHDSKATIAQLRALQRRQAIEARHGRPR